MFVCVSLFYLIKLDFELKMVKLLAEEHIKSRQAPATQTNLTSKLLTAGAYLSGRTPNPLPLHLRIHETTYYFLYLRIT